MDVARNSNVDTVTVPLRFSCGTLDVATMVQLEREGSVFRLLCEQTLNTTGVGTSSPANTGWLRVSANTMESDLTALCMIGVIWAFYGTGHTV